MSKKSIVLLIAVLIVSVIGLRFLGANRARAVSTRASSNIATARVRKDTVKITVTGSAGVFPTEKRVVRSTVSGTVQNLLAQEGDVVEKDRLIAVLQNDDLRAAYEQSRLDLESARFSLQSLTIATATDRASAENKLLRAQTTLSDQERDVASLSMRSPTDGRISAVHANPGETVGGNQLMFSIADDTTMLAVVDIPQADILRVFEGQNASLSFGTEIPSTTGVVYAIGAEGSAMAKEVSVPVTIRFSNTERIYRSGLAVNASIEARASTDSDNTTVYASGVVSAQLRHELRSAAGGTVESIAVKAGDEIKKGQILAVLDNPAALAALASAQNEVTLAAEALERIDAGIAPGASTEQIEQQHIRIAQIESTLKRRASDLLALELRAPIGGTLLSLGLEVGDAITTNTECFSVANRDLMQMVIAVDELDVLQIEVGQKAIVAVEAIPDRTFDAEVSRISPEGNIKDGIANFDVSIAISDPSGILSGMSASAEIVLAQKHDVLVVPAEAVRTADGRKTVAVIDDDVITETEIVAGLTDGVLTEIISGLTEGQTIVISDGRPNSGAASFGEHPSMRPGGR